MPKRKQAKKIIDNKMLTIVRCDCGVVERIFHVVPLTEEGKRKCHKCLNPRKVK